MQIESLGMIILIFIIPQYMVDARVPKMPTKASA